MDHTINPWADIQNSNPYMKDIGGMPPCTTGCIGCDARQDEIRFLRQMIQDLTMIINRTSNDHLSILNNTLFLKAKDLNQPVSTQAPLAAEIPQQPSEQVEEASQTTSESIDPINAILGH